MADLATIGDVEARLLRTVTGVELTAAAVFLQEASEIVRRTIPGIDVSVAADVNLRGVVAGRVAGAVVRVLRNPDGLVQESIGAYAYRRADAVADGSLYLTDGELAQMRPAVSSRRMGSQKLQARGYEPLP